MNRCWFKENTCICFICLTRLFLLIDMRFNCCEFRLADSFWSWVNYIVMSLSVWCTFQCQIKQDMQFRLQLCFLFYVCFAMQKLIVYNIRLQFRLHLHFSFRVCFAIWKLVVYIITCYILRNSKLISCRWSWLSLHTSITNHLWWYRTYLLRPSWSR